MEKAGDSGFACPRNPGDRNQIRMAVLDDAEEILDHACVDDSCSKITKYLCLRYRVPSDVGDI